MSEHLVSKELNLPKQFAPSLGIVAVEPMLVIKEEQPTEQRSAGTGEASSIPTSGEGVQNAELFKRTYDRVIESIDLALQEDIGKLSDNIPAILRNLDALGATPYISSVPEFVSIIEEAPSSIEIARLNSLNKDQAIAGALIRAKQIISGTLVAYWP